MFFRSAVILCAVAGLAAGGCGSDDVPAGPRPATGRAAAPALARAPAKPGEILVSGEAAPREHGPYAFSGRYRVRFEQRAPEDPGLDFTRQTAFTAALVREATAGDGERRALFSIAARSGSKVVEIRGRWTVSVEFGDFPYAIRLVPAG